VVVVVWLLLTRERSKKCKWRFGYKKGGEERPRVMWDEGDEEQYYRSQFGVGGFELNHLEF
jgi:hypothetical protein